jgi:hypothetical protein
MDTRKTSKGAILGILLISLNGFADNASAAMVTYNFEGCNISDTSCTPSTLGTLMFNAPPASATAGWSIGTGDESEILGFTWDGIGSIDLSTTAIAGIIISNSGAELDAGSFNTATNPPKWSLTFGTAPGIDTVIYTPLPNCGSCVYEGDWVVAPVPIPSAVWLFGSGLLGLIGIARKKAG